MNNLYVKNLNQIRKEDISSAGGKGTNLGEMLRAGLPVPGGFVLLTSAYQQFIKTNGLEQKISRILQELDTNSTMTLEKAASMIEEWFLAGKMPSDVILEVEEIYRSQGEPVTAVRSSATAEDLPGMSFAGQYSTFLNVQGLESLLQAIKECWTSLWNSRALSYRMKQRVSNDGLAHGVVVQHLIPSEKSGILFTANPVNGRRDQMLLNSSWGLGEAIVGGEVTPDQWVVQKSDGSFVEATTAVKEVMTVRREHGIELVPVPDDLKETVTLNKEEVDILRQLCLKAEAYFGSPQDLEWAYADGTFYLVQSRPITSLFHQPEAKPGREGLRVFMNMNLYSQAMKEPFTPMGVQVIEDMVRDIIRRLGKKDPKDPNTLWFIQNLGGRLFIDMTEIFRNPKSWRKFHNNPADKDPVTSLALLQLLERERVEITSRRGVNYLKILNRRTLVYGWSAMKKFKVGKKSADAGREAAIDFGKSMVNDLRSQADKLQSLEERILFIETSAADLFLKGFEVVFFVSASSTYLEKAKKLMESCMTDLSDLQLVEKAVPHSVTTEMGMDILKMARDLDAQGRRADLDSPELADFLKTYGHRNSIELDVGIPTWKEEPAYVMNLINTYIDSQTYDDGIQRFEKARTEAEAALRRIRKAMEQAGETKKAQKVYRLLTDYRAMFGVRELPKFYLRHGLAIYRKVIMDIGQELVKNRRLQNTEDVFFITFPDIRSHKDLKELAAKNREDYNLEMNRMAPRVLTSTGESIHAPVMKAGENALMGIPVSPGMTEGRVRVLYHPEEGQSLQVGDILVTTGTNPSWTPLFMKLGGLIMETGGPISHGSVVAREYGLPAVAGVVNATRQLKDGQRVRINGETGSVELLDG
ncbi:phosphoenolpyruvate synthase [Tindallia magadiensis]|uniref:Phosphoenolpyruvate synthase n=1 Tax=Tindallia magadiensis TaxID=69895 RepID=A0A1I3E2C1_9FIRM|nr:PEP/pyruvate-binding domain-containing protein [Tindallia magadiensis]SFH93106.1 phosphoenolpyruvate synthase [Tindallia magadiensis]